MTATIGLNDPRIVELLERWFTMRDAGHSPGPSDLTSDLELLGPLAEALGALEFADQALGGLADPPLLASGVDGRYQLTGQPFIGGMGEVYQAQDLTMNDRQVAYKVMKASRFASPWLVAQFYREAIITDELRQPGIVPIYAKVIDDSQRPAYVMEYIKGDNLYDAIKSLKNEKTAIVPDKSALDLLRRFLDACRIVGVAHEKGYVHADLNLRNIMLVEGWQATRVVDWGSALKVNSDDELRQGHAVAPAYRDPALNLGELPGFTSDVFALGVGLDQLSKALIASGVPLVEGRKRTSAHRALRAIALKARTERPEDRYATAKALAEDLQRFLAGQPVVADTQEPVRERCWRWVARHRTGVTATVAMVLLTTVSLGLVSYAFGRAAIKDQEARRDREFALISRIKNLLTTSQLIGQQTGHSEAADFTTLQRLIDHIQEFKQHNIVAAEAGLKAVRDTDSVEEQRFRQETARGRAAIEQNLDESQKLLHTLVAEFPERGDAYRKYLSQGYLGLAMLRFEQSLPKQREKLYELLSAVLKGERGVHPSRESLEAAMRFLDKAIAVLPQPTAHTPSGKQRNPDLEEIQVYRMYTLLMMNRFTEALQVLSDLIDPRTGFHEQPITGIRPILRMAAEVEQQHMPWSRFPGVDHAKAAAMAEFLAEQPEVSDPAVFNAACALAEASEDKGCDPAERKRRADQAVNYLRRIADREYFVKLRMSSSPPANTIRELRTDKSLDSLRNRPDFQAIVARFP